MAEGRNESAKDEWSSHATVFRIIQQTALYVYCIVGVDPSMRMIAPPIQMSAYLGRKILVAVRLALANKSIEWSQN